MKRILVTVVTAALVAGALYAVPVAAQEAPVLPAEPNVVDPAGDAKFGTPAPVSFTGADVLAAWFTHDEKTISAHVQTTSDARLDSVLIDVGFDPGVGAACMFIDAVTEGATNDARVELYYEDDCGDQGAVPVEEGTFTITEGPDGTAINTITVPRAADPAFGDGKTLSAPFVSIWNNTGDAGAVGIYDTTDPGTAYEMTAAGGNSAKETPPGKNDPPGKKKGCKKGKGKKRGCEGKGKKAPKRGKPAPGSCAPFAPGEAGSGKPTVTVTDAATEEKPLEQTTTLEQSTADVAGDATFDYFNVVVDSEAANAGLYATLEFPSARDYDIDLLHTDGSYAARSHGFNPVGPLYAAPPFQGSEGHGGKTTASSESLVGIKTNDCGGWTIQTSNHLGEGGDFTVKLWLGEAQIDPQAPGEETP